MDPFIDIDRMGNIEMLKESDGPLGFSFQKFESRVLYYRIFYETNPNIPCMESVQIDSSLHVKLQHKGSPIPLPEWFKRNKYKMNGASILVNFVSYMHNIVEMNPTIVLDENEQHPLHQGSKAILL